MQSLSVSLGALSANNNLRPALICSEEPRAEIDRLLDEIKYKTKSDTKYGELVVFLTKYCNAGCSHCIYGSPPLTGDPSSDTVLSWKGVGRIVGIDKYCQFRTLTITGGGEPMLEKEKCLHLLENVAVKRINLFSNGFWASTPERAKDALEKMNEAVGKNETIEKFNLILSVDIFHEETIPKSKTALQLEYRRRTSEQATLNKLGRDGV